MIDWHCHILPGVDDGPATLDEAVEMAAALRKTGFTTVYCTPHLIRGCYEADSRAVMKSISELQGRLESSRIDLTLLPGREYYLDEFFLGYLGDPLPLGDTRCLLVEIPDGISHDLVTASFSQIIRAGFTPLVAHPERCRLLELPVPPKGKLRDWFDVQGSRSKVSNSRFKIQNSEIAGASLLGRLLDMGCKFQGNLGSFAGIYGERARKNAVWLKETGIYSHFGTDSHSLQGIAHLSASGLIC